MKNSLRCLFSARVEQRDGDYVVTIPERELRAGEVSVGEPSRIAILSPDDTESTNGSATDRATATPSAPQRSEPPVSEGETRTVEIETIGEQGDGITRVERGFVIIVPGTDTGERVTIEITDVQETVAFARVVERLSYRQ